MKTSTREPVTLIGGIGKGSELGAALVRQLLGRGHRIAGLTRDREAMASLRQDFPDEAVRFLAGDLTDAAFLQTAVTEIERDFGPVTAYIHNAAALIRGPFTSLAPDQFERAWRAAVLSAVTVCGVLVPGMVARGRGTLLFTGATASLRGSDGFAPFASAKFALRGLAQSLARELGPQGIHVAHIIVDGLIAGHRANKVFGAPLASCIDADDLAGQYLALLDQPASCRTHELDLRPAGESF